MTASHAAAVPVFLRIDRETHPDPVARARAWQEAMSVSMETVFEPDDLDGFAGSASVYPLGPFLVCNIAATAGTILRRPATRAKWKHDHIIVDLVVSGSLRGQVGGRAASYRANDCVIIDLRGGMRLRLDQTRFIGFIMPRVLFEEQMGGRAAVDGLVLDAATPKAQVLGSLLTSLDAQARDLPASVGEALAQALVAVTAACVIHARAAGDRIRRQEPRPSATLAHLRRAILRQAGRPEFGIETLCEQFGLSRTALYRLFEPAGGVAEAIRRRRAALAVRLLARPDTSVKVADVACATGFGNERSLRNALREFYDATPTQIMREGRAIPLKREPPTVDIGRLFDGS